MKINFDYISNYFSSKMDKPIVNRTLDYVLKFQDEIEGITKLSKQAVVVHSRVNGINEFDIYFDAKSYNIINKIWTDKDGRNSLLPPKLHKIGLGVLSGISHAPPIKNYADALEFAKICLDPIVENAKFYEQRGIVEILLTP